MWGDIEDYRFLGQIIENFERGESRANFEGKFARKEEEKGKLVK